MWVRNCDNGVITAFSKQTQKFTACSTTSYFFQTKCVIFYFNVDAKFRTIFNTNSSLNKFFRTLSQFRINAQKVFIGFTSFAEHFLTDKRKLLIFEIIISISPYGKYFIKVI